MRTFAVLLVFLAACGQSASTPPGPLHPDPVSYSPEQVPPEAGSFTTKEGRKGWKVAIPGARPLAGPAYADGKLFLGGGFGSTEFYCVDAETGKILWEYKTGDDGPT